MLGQTLHAGFSSVHRRVGLVFLDILWKAVWLFITAIVIALFLILAASEVQSIQLEASGGPPNNPLLVAVLLRELWKTYAIQVGAGVAAVALTSIIVWVLLESYFRSRLFPAGKTRELGVEPPLLRIPSNFKIFLASGIARTVILLTASLLLAFISFAPYLTTSPGQWPSVWEETRGVAIVGIVIFVAFVFFLTVADTLIRSNAVQLLAGRMLEVAGVIGILLFVETCIVISGLLAVIMAVLTVSSVLEFIMSMAMAVAAAFLMSALHSYLLLVRFFSIDIMRRDVIDV